MYRTFASGRYVIGQNGQYLLAIGVDCYTWYQSQTLDGVPERSLAPSGVDCEILHQLERETK